jgi:putative phage-type endonuclease
MEVVTLPQGSPEWLAHRAKHFNASDAPAMLGVSPHKTRRQLLSEAATGITPEVDAATQRRFNMGHRLEALARPIAEQIVGEPLYPVTGTNGRYSASFDGLTLGGETAFEHKALNAELRTALTTDMAELPLHYRAQVEHQLLVSGADRCLFMASDFDASGALVEEHHRWIDSDPLLRERIVAGWRQFEADLAAFEPVTAAAPAPVGVAPETLPALRIEVEGTVIASNLVAFRETAIAAVRAVKRDLSTDQDFADAELSVKWCREVESRIEAAKAHALAQTASIDELFRALDAITEESRRVRLDLEKRVKIRKDEIRAEIVTAAQRALAKHVAQLSAELVPLRMPDIRADFAAAIKGKRSIESMHDAVDSALAAARIEADGVARIMRANLAFYRERAAGKDFLFGDIAAHMIRPEAEFAEWVDGRIERHRLSVLEDEARLAREREAREAAEKLRREAAAAAAAAEAAKEAATADPTPAPAPDPFPEPGAPAGEPACLSLGDLTARLGFTLSAAFVAGTLGITPAGRSRNAILFTERQFAGICRQLVAHVEAARVRHSKDRTRQGMDVANASR